MCGIERNYSALLEGSSSRFANICEKLPSSHERQGGFKSKWVSGNLIKLQIEEVLTILLFNGISVFGS
jgi:hypothetical protein